MGSLAAEPSPARAESRHADRQPVCAPLGRRIPSSCVSIELIGPYRTLKLLPVNSQWCRTLLSFHGSSSRS